MGFEVDIDAPGCLVYFFSHPAERLIIEGLAPSADVIHGCLADEGLSILLSAIVSVARTRLAAFLTSIGADCIRMKRRT